jgi:hypothetical protein
MSLPMSLCAQMPKLGAINFYGLHKVTSGEIIHATGIEPGGRFPASKGDIEEKIGDLPNVVQARVEAVCCEGDHAALFIGVEEKGAPHPAFRSEPAGEATLPADAMERYQQFLSAVSRAAAHGNAMEDFTAGHSMMDDPAVRALQEQFVEYAGAHLDALRKALHESSETDTRAAAASMIGYGPKKQLVVDELQFALDDPEPAVRSNALRALSALIVYAQREPSAGLRIEPVWFVELLHSVELHDREESAKALALLTAESAPADLRDPAIALMRERALPDLAEMARWPTLRYALPPYLLMGRIAGASEAEVQTAWSKGQREGMITRALDSALPKSKGPRK